MLRRADPDDFDEIINLVEMGEDEIYNRVYSFPNVLKLIETAYLAITVIDREGRVVAFAAFEDHPQVSRTFTALVWRPSQTLCLPPAPHIRHAVTCMQGLRAPTHSATNLNLV